MVLEPGLGIHIGLMDISEYSVTEPAGQLAPEDLALVEVRPKTHQHSLSHHGEAIEHQCMLLRAGRPSLHP